MEMFIRIKWTIFCLIEKYIRKNTLNKKAEWAVRHLKHLKEKRSYLDFLSTSYGLVLVFLSNIISTLFTAFVYEKLRVDKLLSQFDAITIYSSYLINENIDDLIQNSAGILAGAFGLTISILVFVLTILQERTPGSKNLVLIFAKKCGYLVLIALFLGTLAGSLLSTVFYSEELETPTKQAIMQVHIFFMTACFGWMLWTTYNSINSINYIMHDLIVDTLKTTTRINLYYSHFEKARMSIYTKTLEESLIFYHPYSHSTEVGYPHPIPYNSGYIHDVNLSLAKALRKRLKEIKIEIKAAPLCEISEYRDKYAFFIVTSDASIVSSNEKAIMDRFFVIKPTRKSETLTNWNEVSQKMKSSILEKDDLELAFLTDTFLNVLEDYLNLHNNALAMSSIATERNQTHFLNLFSISFGDIFEFALRNGDVNAIEKLLDLLYYTARLGVLKNEIQYLEESLYFIRFSYHKLADNPTLLEKHREQFVGIHDQIIHLLKTQMSSYDEFKKFYISLRRHYTNLMRTVAEREDMKTFKDLYSLMGCQMTARLSRVERSVFPNYTDNNIELYSIKHMSNIAIFAWLFYLMEKDQIEPSKAHAFLKVGKKDLYGYNVLQTFLYRGFGGYYDKNIDTFLGYKDWDYKEHKPFETYSPLNPTTWISPFMLALMLRNVPSSEHEKDAQNYILPNTKFDDIDLKTIENLIDQIDNNRFAILFEDLAGFDIYTSKENLKRMFREILKRKKTESKKPDTDIGEE